MIAAEATIDGVGNADGDTSGQIRTTWQKIKDWFGRTFSFFRRPHPDDKRLLEGDAKDPEAGAFAMPVALHHSDPDPDAEEYRMVDPGRSAFPVVPYPGRDFKWTHAESPLSAARLHILENTDRFIQKALPGDKETGNALSRLMEMALGLVVPEEGNTNRLKREIEGHFETLKDAPPLSRTILEDLNIPVDENDEKDDAVPAHAALQRYLEKNTAIKPLEPDMLVKSVKPMMDRLDRMHAPEPEHVPTPQERHFDAVSKIDNFVKDYAVRQGLKEEGLYTRYLRLHIGQQTGMPVKPVKSPAGQSFQSVFNMTQEEFRNLGFAQDVVDKLDPVNNMPFASAMLVEMANHFRDDENVMEVIADRLLTPETGIVQNENDLSFSYAGPEASARPAPRQAQAQGFTITGA